MTTFASLVSQVRQQLLGYSLDQESLSELTADMGPSDTTFPVDVSTVTALSRGLVEIDDELILVKSFDRNSGTVSVLGAANGRGVDGSTAAAHSAHALVTSSPAFPRVRIKEAINNTIRDLYPDLVVFASTNISNISVVHEYEMPAEARDVWGVKIQTIGPSEVWMQGRMFKFDSQADPTAFPSGKSIQIFDSVTPGRAMRVIYTTEPNTLVNDADDFAATTGFPERVSDVVLWGACARLMPAYDAARLQQQAVESTERATLVPATAALKTASYYQQEYLSRLERERRRMFEENPTVQSYGA
jgi:hypothetical protein